jgi:putative Mg2+ transporter-C (MgtC) family protein
MDAELTLPLQDVFLRLGVAAVLGSAIGLERERLERAAGLRTHALVSLTACLLMIVSAYGFSDVLNTQPNTTLDPSRIAAQVVTGIGFLGAGVIIFRKNSIRGLTTAASLWAVAAIGLANGGGLIWPAIIATAIILALQTLLRPLEMRLFRNRRVLQIGFDVDHNSNALTEIRSVLRDAGLDTTKVNVRSARDEDVYQVDMEFASVARLEPDELLGKLHAIEGVRDMNWTFGPAHEVGDDNPADGHRMKYPITPDHT